MGIERKGDWLQTFTGVQFWPLDPRPEEIFIQDIAHSLSNQCRFTGHVRKFYSVAEHSVRAAFLVHSPHKLWALLHDASEAYMVDLARPIKHHSRMGVLYEKIEAPLMLCVCERFKLSPAMPKEIKDVDNRLAITEKRDLFGPAIGWKEEDKIRPFPEIIVPSSPERAELKFLEVFEALTYSGDS